MKNRQLKEKNNELEKIKRTVEERDKKIKR
jgi:hypothetical protein